MRIGFFALGCKVNQYEIEALKEQAAAAGHQVTSAEELADAYVINTCTVTNLADRKSRQVIRRMKRQNPNAIIAVTGCYVQMHPEEAGAIEGVDLVAGTNEKRQILPLLEQAKEEKQIRVRPYEALSEYVSDGIIAAMESRTRAFVKIQEGCNRFCSYCIIPYARGQVRSRPMDEILQEISGLVAGGFREVVLTGINTALYGTDLGMGGIRPLIQAINQLPGDFRIRLSSLEPTVVDQAYVESLLGYEKLCHHLHLSAQSGSNRILTAMHRWYDREDYLSIVKMLRDFDPSYGITTDLIVGFPGETEGDFVDSLDLVRQAGFLKVHGFRYSRRKGTPADEMDGQVSGLEKADRIHRLEEVAGQMAQDFLAGCKGQTAQVLVEEKGPEGLYIGHAGNYITVSFEGREEMIGTFQEVTLLEPHLEGMKGKVNDG